MDEVSRTTPVMEGVEEGEKRSADPTYHHSVTQVLLLKNKVGGEICKEVYITSTEGWSVRINVKGIRQLRDAFDKAQRIALGKLEFNRPVRLWSSTDDA